MVGLQPFLRSRLTWAILGLGVAGYFAFLVAILGMVATPPRNYLVLHINEDGDLEPDDRESLAADNEIHPYLAGLFDEACRTTAGGQPDQVKTLVLITAPDDLPFRHVWRILYATRKAGFTRWDLRRQGDDGMPEPPPATANAAGGEPASTLEPELEIPYDVTVFLRVNIGGPNPNQLSAIIAMTPDGETALADPPSLRRFFRAKREAGILALRHVRIMAEGELEYRAVLTVVGECRKAGFSCVHYVPPPDWIPPDAASAAH